ncbi:hypothetical protein VQ056_10425 [Paenibacillus sp. JTLBN-2024]
MPFYLMSLDEIEETKSYFCERDELLAEHYSEEEIRKLDPEIKPFYFMRNGCRLRRWPGAPFI